MTLSRRSLTFCTLVMVLALGCGSGSTAAAGPTAITAAPTRAASQPTVAQSKTDGPTVAQPAGKPSPVAQPKPAGSPLASAPRAQVNAEWPTVQLEQVVGNLSQPTHVTHAGDGSGRLFVVEKQGRIVIVKDGAVQPTPFLDISSVVNSRGSEQGLLGLAFHPRYAETGLFYVNYTNLEGIGNTVVASYRVRPDNPNAADPGSAKTLLTIEQPARNHNGGHLVFGPDGLLYIGTGDGGQSGDPWGNAQNKGVLLGKMLRIDVDGGDPYAIPADNPFVGEPGARPEIWAYGLRNPWRYAFDRATGDLYIADVGQNAWEWVHLQRAGEPAGRNFGWDIVEGSHCYPPGTNCDPSQFPRPIAEYDHALGCSVTGGFVYRGSAYPRLQGFYFYADYCSGRLWAARESAGGWESHELLNSSARASSFGEDETGEVYLTGLSDGNLYRLTAAP